MEIIGVIVVIILVANYVIKLKKERAENQKNMELLQAQRRLRNQQNQDEHEIPAQTFEEKVRQVTPPRLPMNSNLNIFESNPIKDYSSEDVGVKPIEDWREAFIASEIFNRKF